MIKAFRSRPFSKCVAVAVTALAALTLGAGAGAGSGHVKDVKAAEVIELTYLVWFSPNMTGVFGGDLSGTFGGAVLSRAPIPGTPIVHLSARYELNATDPSKSFTAIVEGDRNLVTNSAVLNGIVTSGWLAGEQVHSRFDVISSCPEKPSGPCFQGTLLVV
jgi:hypothetical protein